MFTVSKQTLLYGDLQLSMETGEIARQANGAVKLTLGDTILLVTACGMQDSVARDFFPLTVNYQEKTYAGGKIPGGYFKREGRPAERETLTSRLIDRPLRPLFPKGFCSEVQVVATLMSNDEKVIPDVPAIIGSSAALAISGMPFNGPVGAARVGYRNGEYILNPSQKDLEDSELNLVVAGTEDAVLMVESEANELSEEVMLGAVMFGHEKMQPVIQAIKALQSQAGKPAWDWQPSEVNQALRDEVSAMARDHLIAAYGIKEKLDRKTKIDAVYTEVVEKLCGLQEGAEPSADAPSVADVENEIKKLEKDIVRNDVLDGKPRIDGRDTKTVRPIDVKTGVLPRTHGSALFTRGETQAVVVTTLGTGRDAQIIDELGGDRKDQFMLHYNFPPYCVGETGFMGSPKRREIGHGRLARRALEAVIPKGDDFPYVLRIVSEITESNGSSSMASVCGASLSMMDAGVPIKAPVAGIAMGLVKEKERYTVLTDILGDEDHLGDMDFKVAGTSEGVTALQMDIKIQGITREIMDVALTQAKDARMHILEIMNKVISKPREDVSDYAPRIISFKINPDKIREVIGKGGATIRELTEQTGATIDIDDDGTINVAAVDGKMAEDAKRRIEMITAEAEIGKTYEGRIEKILDFGAIVSFLSGKTGLVHISQISDQRIENVSDELEEGEIVNVKVLDMDRSGRIKLSIKDAGGVSE